MVILIQSALAANVQSTPQTARDMLEEFPQPGKGWHCKGAFGRGLSCQRSLSRSVFEKIGLTKQTAVICGDQLVSVSILGNSKFNFEEYSRFKSNLKALDPILGPPEDGKGTWGEAWVVDYSIQSEREITIKALGVRLWIEPKTSLVAPDKQVDQGTFYTSDMTTFHRPLPQVLPSKKETLVDTLVFENLERGSPLHWRWKFTQSGSWRGGDIFETTLFAVASVRKNGIQGWKCTTKTKDPTRGK